MTKKKYQSTRNIFVLKKEKYVNEACCEIIKEINKIETKKYQEDLQRYLHLAIFF